MCGHIEEKEIALLRAEHTLVDEPLGKALTDLLELVTNFEYVPRLACDGIRQCVKGVARKESQ